MQATFSSVRGERPRLRNLLSLSAAGFGHGIGSCSVCGSMMGLNEQRLACKALAEPVAARRRSAHGCSGCRARSCCSPSITDVSISKH